MEVSHVQKIARVLNILVVIALVCNIVILFFSFLWRYCPANRACWRDWGNISAASCIPTRMTSWPPGGRQLPQLAHFLAERRDRRADAVSGRRRHLHRPDPLAGTAGAAHHFAGGPLFLTNAVSLRRAAFYSFIISLAALARLLFSIFHFRSLQPLLSYNALFIPHFRHGRTAVPGHVRPVPSGGGHEGRK